MSAEDTTAIISRLPHAEACATREYVGAIAHTLDGRIDTARTHIRCEAPGCANVILMAQSVSFISCVATTGLTGLGSFIIQCGELQHHCCSPACAAVAHSRCMGRHVYPAVAALFAAHESGTLALDDGPLSHVRITPAEADDPLTARTLAALRDQGSVSRRLQGPIRKEIAGNSADSQTAGTGEYDPQHQVASSSVAFSARQERRSGAKRLASGGGVARESRQRERDGGTRQHKQPSPRKPQHLHSALHAASIPEPTGGDSTISKSAV